MPTVLSNAELRQEILRIFDRTFTLTYVLEAIAVIIATLGMAFSAYYALRMYQRSMHNPLAEGVESREISLRDGLILVPMVACLVVLAFCPQIILNGTEDAANASVTIAKEATR